MPIVLTRIDDRLIHGQVVEGWLKPLGIEQILVVSDEVAADRMQQVLLGMAVPSSVTVTVLSIDDAAARILCGDMAKPRVMMLVSRPADVLRLLAAKVPFPSVNVGGMHYAPGKKQLLRNLCVDEGDTKALMEIGGRGVELEGRVLPQDERVNVYAVVKTGIPQP